MRVMMIGETPESADFSDPAIPAGMTAEKIKAGIDKTLADMRGRGWEAVACIVPPTPEEAKAKVRGELAQGGFDCIVIGGGIRMPASRVELFEVLVNLLRTEAPDTPLAFNTRPETTADAAARWMKA